jgi:hypothetical protein
LPAGNPVSWIDDGSLFPASLGTTTVYSDDGSIELVCGVRGEILGDPDTPPVSFTTYIQCRDTLHSELVLHTLLNYPDPTDHPYRFVEQTSPACGGIEGRRGVFPPGDIIGTVTVRGRSVPDPVTGQPLQDWRVRGRLCLPTNDQQ